MLFEAAGVPRRARERCRCPTWCRPSPLPYTPDVERPEADEAETAQGIVAQMRKIAETVFKDSGHAERGVHAKSHGLLQGTMEVFADLPPVLAQGLFAPRRAAIP